MPLKRGRRSSTVSEESTSVTDYNEDSLQSASSSISTRKKRKLINSKLEVTHCQEILDKLRNVKGDDGHLLTDSFLRLPKKRSASDYYDVVTSPIDLSKIQTRINNNDYQTFLDFETDIEQLVDNAKMYHTSSAVEYQDAVALWTIYEQEKQNIAAKISTKADNGLVTEMVSWNQSRSVSGSESKSRRGRKRIAISVDDGLSDQISLATSDDSRNTSEISSVSDNPLEIFFAAVVLQKTESGKDITPTFTFLPSRRAYPQYYEIIKEPLDLRMLAQKIKNGSYSTIDDLEHDFNVMIKNAKTFNEPKSEVYQYSQDAPIKKTKSSFVKLSSSIPGTLAPRRTRPPISPEELRVKRINNLFQAIYSYQEDNRFLRDIFMSLPSREQYPKYYEVIPHPMDLTIIRKKIDDNKYHTHMDVLEDLKLMFSNAKHFNEESSQVFKDTLTLEKLLKKKIKNFSVPTASMPRGPKKKTETNQSVLAVTSHVFTPPTIELTPQARICEIFQTVRDYHDINGRCLSEPFVKLPSKQDMPEYYDYIKKPMEIQIILYRINNDRYPTVEDLMEDFFLMFDNACKFNEPDSQLYRDALILHRVCLEKREFLTRDDIITEPPNVQNLTNEIMLTIYKQFFNHVDEDGRYLVDSVREIDGELIARKPYGHNPISHVDPIIETVRLNLDIIKHHLEKRRYKRLDRLQEDVFSYLKHVRQVSDLHSQAFEDASKLQRLFITVRDSQCERGEVLLTPALNYTDRYFNQEIEQEIRERKEMEVEVKEPSLDDDREFMENTTKDGSYRMLNSVTRQDTNFLIGDFVRIQKEPGEIPRVGEICAVLVPNSDDIHTEDSNSDGSWIRVNWYYYPQQTIHKSTRRIFEKEIFQTSVYETVALNKIVGKCLIMYIKDYLRQTSKNFKKNDIFVCESYYSVKDNKFRKLKNFVYKNRSISDNFINRDESLTLTRHFSTFVSDIIKFDLNDILFTLENTKESVLQDDGTATESCIYYDQIVCDNGFSVKVGDYVYVKDNENRTEIVRIDQLWKDVVENVTNFSGPWFINAMNVEHLPTRMFFRKEVFLSSLEGASHLLTSIIGKCVILSFSEYCKYRPTEYLDDDVFACQYKYFTEEKVARKLKKGLKKAILSRKALDDEIFFFKKELISGKEPSTMLIKYSMEPIRQEYITRMCSLLQGPPSQYLDDDSKDTSLTLDDSLCSMSVASSGNNGSEKSPKKKKVAKPPSGYVLYSGEIRKKLLKDNPEAQFGMISKEVGQMWRNIPQADKGVYEHRALEIKLAMEKEIEIRKNDGLLKQQGQHQNAAQQLYVANPQIPNQRNYIQVPQPSQQILSPSSTTFQNNAPIQYFQTSNGQVLQFMPSTNGQPMSRHSFRQPVPNNKFNLFSNLINRHNRSSASAHSSTTAFCICLITKCSRLTF